MQTLLLTYCNNSLAYFFGSPCKWTCSRSIHWCVAGLGQVSDFLGQKQVLSMREVMEFVLIIAYMAYKLFW